ncbi:hypothetical protein QF026_004076 [Streptomyces aurantiacus]|uniref:hypothetical protein n=1 Tax=Streptomyces aurantiacus TaxID=47760 RepID=UPI002794FA41|nr:hypothetical protein [Streptomyces aurantiacus]MDQ0775610.1 hypothetical protein [Streptomyces aurantiacus]
MEIDSTPRDVMVIHDDGTVDRCELTGPIDLATRTLAAVVLRPSTKAVDAAAAGTRHDTGTGAARLVRRSPDVAIGTALCLAAVAGRAAGQGRRGPGDRSGDGGHRPRQGVHLGQLPQCLPPLGDLLPTRAPGHPDTPTDKPHIERTLGSVSTVFAQYVAGYTGRSAEMRGKDPAAHAAWSIHELQELLQEWIVV